MLNQPDLNVVKCFMKQKWKGSYACYVVLFFFYYYCMSAFSSVLSVYLAGIGIGIADLSWIVSASSIFGFVIIPAVAYLCDRTGKPSRIRSRPVRFFRPVSIASASSRTPSPLE